MTNITIDKFQFKRGNEANVPSLDSGEPFISEDSHILFVGTPAGNIEFAKKSDVDANTASLADIMQKVLYMSHYKLLAVETTDDGRFTRMLADLHDGYMLFLEANANYTLTSRKQFTQNNIRVFGCGSTFTYTGTDATEILLFGNSTAKVSQTGLSFILNQNANKVTLSDVTNINVGDIFNGYNATAVNGYNDGIYAEVVAIDTVNKVLTLSIDSHKTFTITNYVVYTSIDDISVSDITINCNASMKNIAFNFQQVKNSSFTNLSTNGQGGRVGIIVQGINCEVKRCKADNFYDNALYDNRSGYGINVSGHNILVELNNLRNCKHSITAGTRVYFSTGITYNQNLCYRDSADVINLQVVDMHGNVSGKITNNHLYNCGTAGIAVRDNDVLIEGNHLYSVYTTFQSNNSSKGVWATDNLIKNVIVRNNTFHGYFGFIFALDTNFDAAFQNFIIEGNIADFGGITFQPNNKSVATTVKDIVLKNNIFNDESSINFSGIAGQGVLIEGNTIYTGNNLFNLGIVLNVATSLPAIIKNNSIYHGTQGGECIRTFNDWNIILANNLTMGNTTTNPINTEGKTNNIKSNNLWTKSDGTIQLA